MSSLPPRPCLEQYRRQAKDLHRQALAADAAALDFVKTPLDRDASSVRLTDAQHALARSLGFDSWPKLKAGILESEALGFFADVQSGDLDGVKRYLACAPELAKRVDGEGRTPLHLAAEFGHAHLAEVLVRSGADPKAGYGYSAHTALSWSITISSFEFAAEMVRLGSTLDLFCASGMGDLERVKAFWVDGRLTPHPSSTGSSRFNEEGVRLPSPPESDEDQISDALYMASRHGRSEVVQWLLEHSGDPNFRGYLNGTCLHWAEFSGNDAVADLLRANGARDDLRDQEFQADPKTFGIVVPAAWGISRLLLQHVERHPERLELRSRFGTPLTTAAIYGVVESVGLLLLKGADRSAVHEGMTAREWAEERGHERVARLLSV